MNLHEIVREGMDWTYRFHQLQDISSLAEELIASEGLWVLRFISEHNPKLNHIPFTFKRPGGVCVFTSRSLQYIIVDFPTLDYLNLVVPQFLPCHEQGGGAGNEMIVPSLTFISEETASSVYLI
jgi:hypothetical protein